MTASFLSTTSMIPEGSKMQNQALESLPVAIIGGGPVGLAAAAHLVARGLPVKLYEAGSKVGANIRDWGHVRVFTPWRYCVDAAWSNCSNVKAGRCLPPTCSRRAASSFPTILSHSPRRPNSLPSSRQTSESPQSPGSASTRW